MRNDLPEGLKNLIEKTTEMLAQGGYPVDKVVVVSAYNEPKEEPSMNLNTSNESKLTETVAMVFSGSRLKGLNELLGNFHPITEPEFTVEAELRRYEDGAYCMYSFNVPSLFRDKDGNDVNQQITVTPDDIYVGDVYGRIYKHYDREIVSNGTGDEFELCQFLLEFFDELNESDTIAEDDCECEFDPETRPYLVRALAALETDEERIALINLLMLTGAFGDPEQERQVLLIRELPKSLNMVLDKLYSLDKRVKKKHREDFRDLICELTNEILDYAESNL